MGNIIISLLSKRLIFDFATDYRFSHETIPNANNFLFTDEEFENFKTFLSGKEYEYSTETEDKVEELKEVAEEEFYYEEIANEYDALILKLEINKKDDLNKFNPEIKEILTSEIASRYYYQKGRIIANLQFDKYVKEAIELLNNNNKYNSILAGNE